MGLRPYVEHQLARRPPGGGGGGILIDLASLVGLSHHEYTPALAYARRALHLAEQLADDGLTAAAHRTLGNLLARANQLQEGTWHLERALELAVHADDPGEVVEVCAHLGFAYYFQAAIGRTLKIAPRVSNTRSAPAPPAAGPTVVEAPPKMLGLERVTLQRYLVDIGPLGPDKALGGKYLFCPPTMRARFRTATSS